MTFIEVLIDSISKRREGYNPDDVPRPQVVIWPDRERQWMPILPSLRERLPILTLGSYEPDIRSGPAIWIRCMVERTLSEDEIPEDEVPILYIPGYGHQELSARSECPPELKTLMEYKFFGTSFIHPNGNDWTIPAFLQANDCGIEVQVQSDSATKDAVLRSLEHLCSVEIEQLRLSSPLNAAFFNELLNPDPTRNILSWLNDSDSFRLTMDDPNWDAFLESSKGRFGVNLQEETELAIASKLGNRETGAWDLAWKRFCESPSLYPNIPTYLKMVPSPSFGETIQLGYKEDSWPQINENLENELRNDLESCSVYLPQAARESVIKLAKSHGHRRDWVWAKLGESPLAISLEHLELLAEQTTTALNGDTVYQVCTKYEDHGWMADRSAILALRHLEEGSKDTDIVERVITAIYGPWLEEAALSLQTVVNDGNSGGKYEVSQIETGDPSTCFLFTDGLRLDLAHILKNKLDSSGLETKLETRLTALPSITATAKPAVSPIADLFTAGPGLDPSVILGGATYNIGVLRKEFREAGYQILMEDDLGEPSGKAWTELGDIDELGHNQSSKLPALVESELHKLQQRITNLLANGWHKVIVVTDHGWIFLPTGLPKTELPIHLTDDKIRKGRCARLKQFAVTDVQTVGWYWDKTVQIAMAPSISCFEAGKIYEHGGISPQECVTPMLTITGSQSYDPSNFSMDIRWINMRCYISMVGYPSELRIDLRSKAGDPESSLLLETKPVNHEGQASILLDDDSIEGLEIFCVALDEIGRVVAQVQTTVGGDA